MHISKMILVGAALGAAVIGTITWYSSNSLVPANGSAIAAHAMDARQPISAAIDPATSSKNTRDSVETSDREYGWGPLRVADW